MIENDQRPAPDPAVSGAVSRLSVEFAADVRPPAVQRAVVLSRRDLAGAPVAALPELVERLARQRLLQSLEGRRGRR